MPNRYSNLWSSANSNYTKTFVNNVTKGVVPKTKPKVKQRSSYKPSKYFIRDLYTTPEMVVTPKGNDYVTDQYGNPSVSVGALGDINPNAPIYTRNKIPSKGLPDMRNFRTQPTNQEASRYADYHAAKTAPTIGDLIMGGVGKPMNLVSPVHWYGAIRDWDKNKGWANIWEDNTGLATKEYAEKHPWRTLALNAVGDAILGYRVNQAYKLLRDPKHLKDLWKNEDLYLAYRGSGATRNQFNPRDAKAAIATYESRTGEKFNNLLSSIDNHKTLRDNAGIHYKLRGMGVKEIRDALDKLRDARKYYDKNRYIYKDYYMSDEELKTLWPLIYKKLAGRSESLYSTARDKVAVPKFNKNNIDDVIAFIHEYGHKKSFNNYLKNVRYNGRLRPSIRALYGRNRYADYDTSPTDFLKLQNFDQGTQEYFLSSMADEIKRRGDQLNVYFGLLKGQKLTPRMIKYAEKHYKNNGLKISDKIGDNMQGLLDNIYDYRKAADWFNANTYKNGGTIHINPANRGKFNATKRRTGKTTEELTHSKNPKTRKRAIFAQNAAKWRKRG